ncbi:MAG: KpsF/GutQ family sugar-phosphate isomerase [Proteobacteria bacterium]|nr:KpsF/GutQ family sugar-phosphate isomerase [Pseudomonadota bacterium]
MLLADSSIAESRADKTTSGFGPHLPVDGATARGREVIRLEAAALALLETSIDDSFDDACRLVLSARRQLILSGMGKSGHIARKIAATFSATGTPATYIHPIEAGHGDIGTLARGDVLLVLSNSGDTPELRMILNYARKLKIPVIGMSTRRDSMLTSKADVALILPRVAEACSANIAPTTSTTMQLALGDALAMAVMDLRGMSKDDLRALHPAGIIGFSLSPVGDVMHCGNRMPLVDRNVGMPEAISRITTGCFGVVGVTDDQGNLVGMITDGDLRRRFGQLQTAFAYDVMTPNPKVIGSDMTVEGAIAFLNTNKITAAFVVDQPGVEAPVPIGIVHIHDLLRP